MLLLISSILLYRRQAQHHVDTIRYYLLISVLSAVLVSVPNFISLYKVYLGQVLLSVSKPSEWLQTLNAGINLFVYITLKKEFRQRLLYLLNRGRNVGKKVNVNDRINVIKPQRVAAVCAFAGRKEKYGKETCVFS
uniref:G_PROTEIN_RECEP_F1_2 domain-containing protein n=1 Tax=Angiostrongylus cantonensis TaxID=6313 RepID=A0A0K0DAL1_ANGCA